MKNLTRNDAVLLAILSELGRKMLRTNLVKLTYLLDNARMEQLGTQMTEFVYHWDHHGPNAVGNAIVHTLSSLSEKGLVLTTQRLTPNENYANYYRASAHVDVGQIPLTPEEWQFVHAIVERYGHLPRGRIVSESKKTAPVLAAKQYDVLQLRITIAARQAQERFFEDTEFVRSTKKALSTKGSYITLEDLRAEVG